MTKVLICEKPTAAKKIAEALADKKPKVKNSKHKVSYYEFEIDGKKHITVAAVGHLYSLKDTNKGWKYPTFNMEWIPVFEANKSSKFAKKYFKTIKELVSDKKEFIVATDLDEEGSVIGYNILRFLCNKENAKRMTFSTLTKEDLIKAYKNASKKLDFPRIESGLTRHYLDFLWGVNVTRALTLSIKNHGKTLNYYVLSAGRVQTPMLYFLIKREKKISKFKPKPYWELEAKLKTKPQITCFHKTSKFWDKKEVKKSKKNAEGKSAIAEKISTKKRKKSPPNPFDLTSLQRESYKLFGYSPKKTTSIAQNLYTNGYISYPRTSSQKLPKQIGYREILKKIFKIKKYSKLTHKILKNKKLVPKEGKKKDAAHPAIHPTAETPKLSKLKPQEKKLYDLIVRRFMSVFGKPAIREYSRIDFDIGGENFYVRGSRTIEKNWMEYYGKYAKFKEVELPKIEKKEEFKVKKLEIIDKETQPPNRYSQGSIVRELEKNNIGTKATRANILQTLYDRGYIEGRSIKVTDLGMKVGNLLHENIKELTSEKLTRKFEKQMKKVEKGKIKKEAVIKKAEKVIKKISNDFRKKEKKIGIELEKAILKTEKEKNTLGKCLKCGDKLGGQLKILYSPKTKSRFVGCSSYPKCKNIYPLPRGAKIIKQDKICEHCNTPIVKVIRKGKRPFTMCLDTECKTKENWGKKKKTKKKNKTKK